MRRSFVLALFLVGATAGGWPWHAGEAAVPLQDALAELRREAAARAAEDAEKLARFEEAYSNDAAAQKREAQALNRLRNENESMRAEIESERGNAGELYERLGRQVEELDRLFAILRQQSADLATALAASPVSANYPGRSPGLHAIAGRENNPDLGDLEQMWHAMLGELVLQGRVLREHAPLITVAGRSSVPILRTGVFSTLSDRGLLLWDPAAQAYRLPARPVPAPGHVGSEGHQERFLIDTGRGAGLARLSAIPTWQARILAGGNIAVLILALAALGVFGAVMRWIFLARLVRRTRRQSARRNDPRDDNPLGRIWLLPQRMQGLDADNLALALDEAVLREASQLRRGEALIRLLAALMPLLGLLGTVTGMIATFESITRFGAGDPVLMADGISQALVTTWLGLGAAVPLVLAHAWLAALCRALIERLEEASATLIAGRARG